MCTIIINLWVSRIGFALVTAFPWVRSGSVRYFVKSVACRVAAHGVRYAPYKQRSGDMYKHECTGRKTQCPRLGMYASICRKISYNQLGVTMLNEFKILNGNQIANQNWQEENCYRTHHVAKFVRQKPHSWVCFLRSEQYLGFDFYDHELMCISRLHHE
jgi:hypothetical protein